MSEFVQIIERHADRRLEIEVDEAQPPVIVAVPDHDEGVAPLAQQLDAPVRRADLHQHHAIDLSAAVQVEQAAFGDGIREQAQKVGALSGGGGGADDEIHVERVEGLVAGELERKEQGDIARFAGAKPLRLGVRAVAGLLDHTLDALAGRLRYVLLVVEDTRDRRDGDARRSGNVDYRKFFRHQSFQNCISGNDTGIVFIKITNVAADCQTLWIGLVAKRQLLLGRFVRE